MAFCRHRAGRRPATAPTRSWAQSRLRFIRAAQSVALSLGEIREILAFRDRGELPCVHVVALIERHAADLEERIAALARMRRDLRRLAKRARDVAPREAGSAAFCHIIETIRPGPEVRVRRKAAR